MKTLALPTSTKTNTNGNRPSEWDDDPYVQAQLVDIGNLERSERNGTAWRRATFALAALLLLALVGYDLEVKKEHTEVLVYGQDTAGTMQLLGYAGHSRTPTEVAISAALAELVAAMRDIPGGNDAALVDRNAAYAFAMFAKGSPGDRKFRSFLLANNPKILAAKGITRTVLNPKVTKLTDLTWQISWTEHVVSNNNASDHAAYGSVTFAGPPMAPADPTIGATNPTGIFINDTDFNCPPL